jgi:hypothetical protein
MKGVLYGSETDFSNIMRVLLNNDGVDYYERIYLSIL